MKRFKITACVSAFCLAMTAAAAEMPIAVSAAETVWGDFAYEVQQDHVVITDYFGQDTAVSIPDMIGDLPVMEIGSYAFSGSDLIYVYIPYTVTEIGDGAFEYCEQLTEVYMSNSVTTVGFDAFRSCSQLRDITFSENLWNFGGEAFWGTAWLEERRAENPLVVVNDIVVDGMLCTGNVVLPEGIRGIGSFAFYSSSMTAISLPDSLWDIQSYAFKSCANLTELVIPDGIYTLAFAMLDSCTSLREVVIPDSVMWIEDYAFYCCDSLTEIVIPENVTSIGYSAFAECYALRSITLPESLREIDGTAFQATPWLAEKSAENPLVIINNIAVSGADCSGVVEIPEGVRSISQLAFYQNEAITQVILPDTLEQIGNSAFGYCTALYTVTLPEQLRELGDGVFSSCSSLTSITIPYSVQSIGSHCFAFCSALEEITIENPDCELQSDFPIVTDNGTSFSGVIRGYIGSTAEAYAEAYGCRFEAINAYNGLSYRVADQHVEILRYFGDAETLTVPAYLADLPVTVIEAGAFEGCSTLRQVVVPATVEEISFRAFSECAALREITIENPACYITLSDSTICNSSEFDEALYRELYHFDGTIYGYTGSSAHYYAEQYGYAFESLGDAQVSGVCGDDLMWGYNGATRQLRIYGTGEMSWDTERVPWFGLKNCIREISLPNGLTSIPEYAFQGCDSLKEIVIPDSVTTLEAMAFDFCINLERAVIPGSIETLTPYVFGNCWSLHDVQIGEGVKTIQYCAFMWSDALETVVIPQSVTEIEEGAFATLNLKDVTVLNPACHIADSPSVFCNLPEGEPSGFPDEAVYDGVIRGYAGSTAAAYAAKFGYRFVALEAAAECGDVDGDNEVTSWDAQIALRAYLASIIGRDDGLTPQQKAAADVNGDGQITSEDAQYILIFYLNNTVLNRPITWEELLNH